MTSCFTASPPEGDDRGRWLLFPVVPFEKSWEGSDWPDLDHILNLGPVSFEKSRWFTVIDNPQ